uniref:5'-3' DNA helicase ZGRF1 n=1 Tax=Meleagris gallopavo TaxID=9103 RepID=G1NEQ7_MELGA
MASQEFTVLYTHQKMKKSKTWQDGILRIRSGENKAILLDDKGQYLESMFVKSQVNSGDNLESERYLIMVEEAKMKEKSCEGPPRKAEIVDVNRRGVKPGILPPKHLSVGLKRKFTGFQGPRQVEKKVSTAEDEERMAVLPISEQNQDRFPSRFYITSPLFSTIYKKNAETSLSAGLHEDGGTDNRDRVTPSSVVSLPFLHTCNEIEKKNSDQSTVKPESPLITGHAKSNSWTTGHGAVSQNIRSTTQIIALLKSKPQVCREQVCRSEVTECHRFQTLENINSLCNLKSTTLPAFSVNSDKKIAQTIQHLPFTKEMVNDKKEHLLINSSEPCDKEIAGQRHDKKANNLSQDLQDPCRTNSSVLSESTINRVSDSLFVSSCSASPVTFEKPLSRYREHLAINGLQDNSSVKSQSDLQLKQNSERMPSDLELSEDLTVTENAIAKQGLSTHGRDCSPDKQVMEVNFDLLGAFDFHDMDNEEHCERNKKELTEEDMLSKSADCLEGEDRPVEFQGHQIKGSASSETMLRAPCSQLGWQQYPDNTEFHNFLLHPLLFHTTSISLLFHTFHPIPSFSFFPHGRNLSVQIQLYKEKLLSCSEKEISLSTKPAVFSMSASGPEDRNYETSVFEECMEDRQRKSVHPVFSNVTSQCRQSKWLKYLNSAHCDLITQNSNDTEAANDIYAENVLGMLLGDTGESQSSTANSNAPGPVPLLTAKSMLGECCADSSNQDLISDRKLLSCHLNQTPLTEPAQKVLSHLTCRTVTGDVQDITVSELSFPNADKVKHANLPKRKIAIPTEFQSHVHYKQVFKAALTEHLNIMLFELSQRLHNALSKVDTSFYSSLKDEQSESKESCVPLCDHMRPAKVLVVKKEGQNKGRLFYACDAPRAERCSFFKWIEEANAAQIKKFRPSVVLHDVKSIGAYLRNQKIFVFDGCQLFVRYSDTAYICQGKLKKLRNVHAESDGDSKNKLYLKLSSKEHYSLYSKDDIWVVSKTLNFDPLDTFIASSAFFGPTHNNEVELLPLKGYHPSNWHSHIHALLVCNASGELISLRNMEEYFNPSTLPLIPYLLKIINRRKFIPPAMSLVRRKMYGSVSTEVAVELAEKMILTFSLNPDQATSLIHIAQMMSSHENMKPVEEHQIFPITIIHGVFGAGKSYLLSVVILFLVQLFESSEAKEGPELAPWKLLIASSTNVAVDRILLCLLDLGFEDFIRVGSIRKITKAILPYSLHAGSGNENEQLKELLALMKEDLAPAEKMYVRKSIERHKLGTNKSALQQVKVVGVTCAACPFPCLDTLKFPVVVLDECSQMTEPTSLLPIARFQCEKLVLVGDPKQLPPTIQGSESTHDKGLEQTLFDRLCLMGHKTILLRTQYRCHPTISAIANELFYEGNLIDGVSEKERSPLLDWLPTLCFYSVSGLEQIERDNSFYNMAEVHFTVKLIQSLIASGIHGSAVGVITFYKSQMYKIQNLLRSIHSEAFPVKAVQVSTVDAFQGAEKEIIVLSCVRTRQTGFTDSEKRMNVALTRAKRHLLIVGNLACLSKNRLYERVINHCKGITFFSFIFKNL